MPRGIYVHKPKHGHNSNAGRTPTYMSWDHMIQRCRTHKDYAGRGIRVCERWKIFRNFLADMGNRPDGTTLERCDTNGDYEKSNCRWATRAEQQNNRRDNVVIEYDGVRRTVTEWADILGIKKGTLDFRIRRGWDHRRALEAPVDCDHTFRRGVMS